MVTRTASQSTATSCRNGPSRLRRILVLGSTAGVVLQPRPATAIADLILLIVPALVPALIQLLSSERQLQADALRRADEQRQAQTLMELERSRLALERSRLLHEQAVASRADRMALLQLVASTDEERRRSIFERLDMSLLVDSISRETVTTVVSEDADQRGTRLGLYKGHIAVERGGQGGWLDNLTAASFGALTREPKDPIPVPLTGLVRQLDAATTTAHQQALALHLGLAEAEVERSWRLAGERRYSRAQNPKSRPDLAVASFVPTVGGPAVNVITAR